MSLDQRVADLERAYNESTSPNDLAQPSTLPAGGRVVVTDPAVNEFKTVPSSIFNGDGGSTDQVYYDEFTFKGQLADQSDLNNITVTANFEVFEINNTGAYYLLVKDTAPENLVLSRIYIGSINAFFDINFSIYINGVNYTVYLLQLNNVNAFQNNSDYRFNIWLNRAGTTTGTGGNPPVEAIYNDIAEMLADQANQNIGEDYLVLDASADPNVTSGAAYYALTQKTGVLADDYILTNPVEITPATDFKKWQVNEGFDAGDQTIIRSFGNKLYLLLARSSFFRTTDIVQETNTFFQWEVILDGDAGGGTSITNITEIPNRSYNDLQDLPTLGDLAALDDISTNDINNNAVTNIKLANMNENTIKGRGTGNGQPEDLTPSEVRTIINVADGAQVNEQPLIAAPPASGTISVPVNNRQGSIFTQASTALEIFEIAAGGVVGGWAIYKGNWTTQPSVTGATELESSEFISGIDMYLVFENMGDAVRYYFLEI